MVKAHTRKTKKGVVKVQAHKRINEAEVGDGMVPNMYWVSWSNDFYICKDGMCDWASDTVKFKVTGGTKGPFKTFSQAMRVLEDLAYENMEQSPRMENMNFISVDDRLSGQIYERAIRAYETESMVGKGYSYEIESYRDTKFTEENLAKRGMRFE